MIARRGCATKGRPGAGRGRNAFVGEAVCGGARRIRQARAKRGEHRSAGGRIMTLTKASRDRQRGRCAAVASRLAPLALVPALLLLLAAPGALARPMHVVESFPMAGTVIDGRNAQYYVRFDGPVDHRGSRLEITRDGRVVER